jgi:hypothetical protein
MMEEPRFLSIEEARAAEKYYQKLEEEFWKYGHMMSASNEWLQECIEKSTDLREVEIATNLLAQNNRLEK